MSNENNWAIESVIDKLCVVAETVLAERQAQWEREVKRSNEEKLKQFREEWEPALESIRDALPEEVHGYIQAPAEPREARGSYAPVIIRLPGCTDIAAWALANKSVSYEATRGELYQDEDGEWEVSYRLIRYRRAWVGDTAEPSFAVAVRSAVDAYADGQELEHMAAERNRKIAHLVHEVDNPGDDEEEYSISLPDPEEDPAEEYSDEPVQPEEERDAEPPLRETDTCLRHMQGDLALVDTAYEHGVISGLMAIAMELRALNGKVDHFMTHIWH